jgi:hypothetical protein
MTESGDPRICHCSTTDNTLARRLIERLRRVADIVARDDKRKSQDLTSLFRGQTQARRDRLEIFHINIEDWNDVKTSFL